MVTHNGTAGHIYVDGVDKNGTSTNKTMVPTTNDLYVGALHDGTLKFNGSLQYISFYNVALAQADVPRTGTTA